MRTSERFGTNVRRLRAARGLSQEDLARACGVHRTEVSLVERGERDVRLTTILRLARGLRVPPAQLLDGLD